MKSAAQTGPTEPSPYQFLPPLLPEEYEALKADIKRRGVQVPVEVDEVGQTLDGHHRIQICRELGITTYPRVVRAGLDERAKQEHALVLNLSRRHLTRSQRRDVVVRLSERGWSTRRIAAATGVSAPTVLRDLRAAGVSDVTPADETDRVVVGADGKTYPARKRTSVVVTTQFQQETAQEALLALGDEAPGRMTDLRRLERLRRDQRARTFREAARLSGVPLPDGVDLRHCRFEDLDVEPGSAAVVFTDPPYDKQSLEDGTWERLSKFAEQVLRPGGLLVAYAPTMWLPQAIDALHAGSSLEYHWQYVITFKQHPYQVRARGLASAYRPVLVFRQPGGPAAPPWTLDVFQGSGRSKESGHPWEQAAGEAEDILRALTLPGDLVVDPCLGSGTTAVAAYNLGLLFIGCDSNEDWVNMARARVARCQEGAAR